MRKNSASLLFCLIIAATLAAAAQAAQNEWQQYSYASDGFAVSAPSQPEFSKQDKPTQAGNVEVHYYAIDLGGNSGVMISTGQFQAQETAPPKTTLQKAKENAIATANAKVTSEHEITLQNFPGLEFEAANDQFHTRVRMYLVNARLITMMAIAPKDTELPAGAEHVFSSFKILK